MDRAPRADTTRDVRVRAAAHCLICGRTGAPLYRNLRDRLFGAPGEWSLARCPTGHLAWLDPRPVSDDIPKLYERYFTHGSEGDGGASGEAVRGGRTGAAAWVARAGRWLVALSRERDVRDDLAIGAEGRLLDVGCGDGRFLERMRAAGWDVAGVEPDARAVGAARERLGLSVHHGGIESEPGDAAFDVVTMNHVIEHADDPVATLAECGRRLAPRGRLIVTTPNVASLGRHLFGAAFAHLDPPRHLQLFSPAGLRACAERAGLRVAACRTSAREAAGTWGESCLIRRHGTVPARAPEKHHLGMRSAAMAFEIAERLLCRVLDVGEEIVLTAVRPDGIDRSRAATARGEMSGAAGADLRGGSR